MARSRNQPRRRVAWLLLVILLVLIALVARVDAAPDRGWVERAIRDAEALSRAEHAGAFGEDGDEEAEDRAAERAEIASEDDESEGQGEDDDALSALVGERTYAEARMPGKSASADDAALRALLGERAHTEARMPGEGEGEDDDALSALVGEHVYAEAQPPGELGDDGERSGLLGDADAGAPAGLAFDAAGAPALGDDGEAGWSGGAGALAMLDAELAPGDATAGLDAANAGATAGAQEAYEQWMRHQRPSQWGRLDVGMSWRHRRSEPIHTPAYSHDEIWLVATWRR